MNQKDIGDIADMIEAIGANLGMIADGLDGDLCLSLLFHADLLDKAATDLRQAVGKEAGTP